MKTVQKTPELIGGPYEPPAWNMGDIVPCLYRDYDTIIVGVSDGPIPWPLGERQKLAKGYCRKRGIVVNGSLVDAIKTESLVAVAHWWGVGKATAQRWRLAIMGEDREGVLFMTTGTQRLFRNGGIEKMAVVESAIRGPQLRAKAAEALSASTRFRRPEGGWTEEEDRVLLAVGSQRASQQLGRTLRACNARLFKLRHPNHKRYGKYTAD